MSAEGASLQILRNALSGGGRFALGAITALLVTPYALSRLGDARFGLWALAGAVLSGVRLLDLGLNRALTREVASAQGRGDPSAALAAVQTARLLALGLAGLALLVAWLLRDGLVLRLFSIPPALQDEAAFVILGTVAVAGLELAFGPYQASLDGLGRMDLSNTVDALVQRLLSPLGVVVVLGAGWGLRGLVWKNLLAALLAGIAYVWLLKRKSRSLGAGRPRLHRGAAGELLAFGRHVQVVNLGSALIEPIAKTLLSRGAGLEALALYELASRVTSQLGGAFMALANAIFPAAASLAAENGGRAGDSREPRASGALALTQLQRSATRYSAWLILPAWAILAGLAKPFVQAWVGPDHAQSAELMVLLAAGWALALLSLPAFLVAQAGGEARLSTIGGLVTAGSSIGLSLLLAGPYGSRGVALAVSIGLAAGGLTTLMRFARRFGLSPAEALPVGWRVWLASALAAAAARRLADGLPPAWLDPSARALLAVAACGLAGLGLAGLFLLLSAEIGRSERRRLTGWLHERIAGKP